MFLVLIAWPRSFRFECLCMRRRITRLTPVKRAVGDPPHDPCDLQKNKPNGPGLPRTGPFALAARLVRHPQAMSHDTPLWAGVAPHMFQPSSFGSPVSNAKRLPDAVGT